MSHIGVYLDKVDVDLTRSIKIYMRCILGTVEHKKDYGVMNLHLNTNTQI